MDFASNKKGPSRASEATMAGPRYLIYQCDECKKSPLIGSRWRCHVCPDFDLCAECFTAKKHDQSHATTEVPIASGPSSVIPPGSYAMRPVSSAGNSMLAAPSYGGGGNSLPPIGSADEERPRRAIRPSAPHLSDPIQRMEWVLTSTDLGTIPLSQMSTQTATTFMLLYDAGLAAMERHRTGKAHSQIVGRIALVLAGIPRRRPGSYTVHEVGTPLEQDSVSGVMATLVAQVQTLDSNGLFAKPIEAAGDVGRGGPSSERMDLTTIADNVEKGKYFKGVDTPETALALFQRHLLSIWSGVQRTQPPEHPIASIAARMDKLCRNAISELRDALGVTSIVDLPNVAVPPPPVETETAPKKRQKRAADAEEDSSDTIKALREEVARAHQRIDALISLLSDKMVTPLSKGLDRIARA